MLVLKCGHQAISYNSCRNRHCPKCHAQAREHWLAARERELLATSYFHVVFTVPHELTVLALDNPRVFYDLLFTTLLKVARDPQHLGAEIGVISILHTWGQNLLLHPHIHCAIPAGGLSPNHSRWIRPRYPFFLPVKVLSRVFRGKFLAGLKRFHRRHNYAAPDPPPRWLIQNSSVDFCGNCTVKTGWSTPSRLSVVQPKSYAISVEYTHRIAISNHRLLGFDGERVTFRLRSRR